MTVTSNAPRLNVGSIPRMLIGEGAVQNLTRSFSVQSKANTIIGYGAPFTIRTNASGALALSLSLHIIINEKRGSVPDLDLHMSLTCCLLRGRVEAEPALSIPPTSFDTKFKARFAVMVDEAPFNFSMTLGFVRT